MKIQIMIKSRDDNHQLLKYSFCNCHQSHEKNKQLYVPVPVSPLATKVAGDDKSGGAEGASLAGSGHTGLAQTHRTTSHGIPAEPGRWSTDRALSMLRHSRLDTAPAADNLLWPSLA